ncbi:uncharacterized protein [Vulpes vulpes]|uniref:Basic proline-rich protein-like n=1 Tax=Vulpes vulpes TaxID=9627 RepID=A0ABM4YLU8_VULVU
MDTYHKTLTEFTATIISSSPWLRWACGLGPLVQPSPGGAGAGPRLPTPLGGSAPPAAALPGFPAPPRLRRAHRTLRAGSSCPSQDTPVPEPSRPALLPSSRSQSVAAAPAVWPSGRSLSSPPGEPASLLHPFAVPRPAPLRPPGLRRAPGRPRPRPRRGPGRDENTQDAEPPPEGATGDAREAAVVGRGRDLPRAPRAGGWTSGPSRRPRPTSWPRRPEARGPHCGARLLSTRTSSRATPGPGPARPLHADPAPAGPQASTASARSGPALRPPAAPEARRFSGGAARTDREAEAGAEGPRGQGAPGPAAAHSPPSRRRRRRRRTRPGTHGPAGRNAAGSAGAADWPPPLRPAPRRPAPCRGSGRGCARTSDCGAEAAAAGAGLLPRRGGRHRPPAGVCACAQGGDGVLACGRGGAGRSRQPRPSGAGRSGRGRPRASCAWTAADRAPRRRRGPREGFVLGAWVQAGSARPPRPSSTPERLAPARPPAPAPRGSRKEPRDGCGTRRCEVGRGFWMGRRAYFQGSLLDRSQLPTHKHWTSDERLRSTSAWAHSLYLHPMIPEVGMDTS